MSDAKRNKLEVIKVIKDNIESALTAFGHDGWGVMEFANASFQNYDKVILMNLVRTKRVGWQAAYYPVEDNELKRRDEWIEEQSWQITCIRKRDGAVGVSTVLPEDMSSDLVTWFNGRGCDIFRRSNMANLRIASDAIFVYNDNSDLYQKRAVFTVKIQVPKELTIGEVEVDTLVPKIYPV